MNHSYYGNSQRSRDTAQGQGMGYPNDVTNHRWRPDRRQEWRPGSEWYEQAGNPSSSAHPTTAQTYSDGVNHFSVLNTTSSAPIRNHQWLPTQNAHRNFQSENLDSNAATQHYHHHETNRNFPRHFQNRFQPMHTTHLVPPAAPNNYPPIHPIAPPVRSQPVSTDHVQMDSQHHFGEQNLNRPLHLLSVDEQDRKKAYLDSGLPTNDNRDNSKETPDDTANNAFDKNETVQAKKRKLLELAKAKLHLAKKKQELLIMENEKKKPKTGPAESSQEAMHNAARSSTESHPNEGLEKEKSNAHLSKEQLQKKKEEIQVLRDLSYWKHYVSKQEHMLSDVDAKLEENEGLLQECHVDHLETDEKLCQVKDDLEELLIRERIVSSTITTLLTKLLESRKKRNKDS